MGSDVIDLPLPKNIRLNDGFCISRIFVYELNIGICGLVFCIQFKCRGKVIHNPGKVYDRNLIIPVIVSYVFGPIWTNFNCFYLNPCVQREKGSFIFKFFLGFQTFFESKFRVGIFSEFTYFLRMVIKFFFTCNNAKLRLKVKIFL